MDLSTLKKIGISFLFVYSVNNMYAQMAIGKLEVSNSSVLLEFSDEKKGIILPGVLSTAMMENVADGTLIFDRSDSKVKFRIAGEWIDFSRNGAGKSDHLPAPSEVEEVDYGQVIFGGFETNVTGVCVLESDDKVLVLPQVTDPHLNIVNPSAGLIVYDPVKNLLATFNGTVWSFWTYED